MVRVAVILIVLMHAGGAIAAPDARPARSAEIATAYAELAAFYAAWAQAAAARGDPATAELAYTRGLEAAAMAGPRAAADAARLRTGLGRVYAEIGCGLGPAPQRRDARRVPDAVIAP